MKLAEPRVHLNEADRDVICRAVCEAPVLIPVPSNDENKEKLAWLETKAIVQDLPKHDPDVWRLFFAPAARSGSDYPRMDPQRLFSNLEAVRGASPINQAAYVAGYDLATLRATIRLLCYAEQIILPRYDHPERYVMHYDNDSGNPALHLDPQVRDIRKIARQKVNHIGAGRRRLEQAVRLVVGAEIV